MDESSRDSNDNGGGGTSGKNDADFGDGEIKVDCDD